MQIKSISQLFRFFAIIHLLVSMLFLSTNCVKHDKKGKPVAPRIFLENDIENPGAVHLISEIADTAYYFKPIAYNDILIDKIIKVEKNDSLYFIQDKTHHLFVYRQSGKLKGTIGNIGRGPNEYIEISDFAINPRIDEIAVLDGTLKKVCFYNSNGKLINTIKVNHFDSQIRYLDSCTIITYTNMVVESLNNHFLFNLIKTNGAQDRKIHNVASEKIPVNSPVLTFEMIKNYYDTIYYFDNINNVFYHVDYDTLVPILNLDFGKFNMPRNFLLPEKFPTPEDFQNMSSFLSIHWFLETNSYFFFKALLHKRLKLFAIDKKTYKVLIPNVNWRAFEQGFLNDLAGGGIFWPEGSFTNGELYSTVDPYKLNDLLKQSIFIGYGIDTKKLEQEIINIPELSNPWIQIIKLKDCNKN